MISELQWRGGAGQIHAGEEQAGLQLVSVAKRCRLMGIHQAKGRAERRAAQAAAI